MIASSDILLTQSVAISDEHLSSTKHLRLTLSRPCAHCIYLLQPITPKQLHWVHEPSSPTCLYSVYSTWYCKIRDKRVIRDTHVNTCLAETGPGQTETGPEKSGPVPVLRQSNGPGPGPVLATDSAVWD